MKKISRIVLISMLALSTAWVATTYPKIGHIAYENATDIEASLFGFQQKEADIGELNLSTLIFLTKTILEIPENKLLSVELLNKIENYPESLQGEIKYISYAINFSLGEIKKANFCLKEAYNLNPAIYDYFRDIFPIIPQLHVFKNMNAN